MFAVEVEDVNAESHVFEEGVILDMLGKGAIDASGKNWVCARKLFIVILQYLVEYQHQFQKLTDKST